jgi:hypothetical protein
LRVPYYPELIPDRIRYHQSKCGSFLGHREKSFDLDVIKSVVPESAVGNLAAVNDVGVEGFWIHGILIVKGVLLNQS